MREYEITQYGGIIHQPPRRRMRGKRAEEGEEFGFSRGQVGGQLFLLRLRDNLPKLPRLALSAFENKLPSADLFAVAVSISHSRLDLNYDRK